MKKIIAPLLLTLNLAQADLMLVGNDEKMTWNEDGQLIKRSTDKNDNIMLFDLSTDPLNPKLKAKVNLVNSIFGPPSNISISPDEKIGFVANSLNWIKKDGDWAWEPSDQLYILDLENGLKLIETIKVGKQPSGIDLSKDGKLLLVTNRAENTISALSIDGSKVKVLQTIDVKDSPAGVAISPDGKTALFLKKAVNKVGVLKIAGSNISYNPLDDINVGIEPYNVKISPKGNIALVNNIGTTNGNDGHVDTVSVIDLTTGKPYVCDQVTVGDGPEGLTFNHDGSMAISVLINGSHKAKADPATAWAYNKNGAIAVLKIDGNKVTKTQHIEVGGMPEGAVFNNDGSYLYIGNFKSKDITILKVDSGKVSLTGKTIELGSAPGSMGRSK
ncbi:MAG: beta-propeller fold lactonase family protein [Lentisphaeraceae bacterium]|nr:beta-propeller fold lactonase family protein [Lentisphaeraceae bacterium]